MGNTAIKQSVEQSAPKLTKLAPPIMPVKSTSMDPILNPQIGKDLEAYLEARMRLKMAEAEVKKLAAMLGSMKNVMWGVQEFMAAVMGMQGDQIGGLAAVDNLDSDLRSEVGSGESTFNGIENGGSNFGKKVSEAKKLIQLIDQMEAFLKYEKSLGNKSVFGQGAIKNLQDAINSIKSTFGGHWGQPSVMADLIAGWVRAEKKGKYEGPLKTIQDAFQTLNQSTSALSTTTNTQLQFKTNEYKQTMGMDESIIEGYMKSLSAMVNNQRSN